MFLIAASFFDLASLTSSAVFLFEKYGRPLLAIEDAVAIKHKFSLSSSKHLLEHDAYRHKIWEFIMFGPVQHVLPQPAREARGICFDITPRILVENSIVNHKPPVNDFKDACYIQWLLRICT